MNRKKISIAVSGDAGSFSEQAGLDYAKEQNFEPDIQYAIHMEGVFESFKKNEAEFGILPIHNSITGPVKASFQAMGRHNFAVVDFFGMQIQQCLLAKSSATKKDIKKIVSYSVAINQCKKYLQKNFPDAQIIEYEDTAKAAKDLAAGILGEDTAVIASQRSAEIHGLAIVAKNIQDQKENLTTFIIIKNEKA